MTTMMYIQSSTAALVAFAVRWMGFGFIQRGGLMPIRISCRDEPSGSQ